MKRSEFKDKSVLKLIAGGGESTDFVALVPELCNMTGLRGEEISEK